MNKEYIQAEFDITGIKIDEEKLEILSYRNKIYFSMLENRETGKSTLYVYGRTVDEIFSAAKIMRENFFLDKYRKKKIFENKYLLKYLKTYKPFNVGRYRIIPYFHKDETMTKKTEIILNPGFSFGTGEHPTTKLVLLFMSDTDLTGLDVLDCGVGSGILSIAASKSGAKRIVGFDTDDSTVVSTADNSKLNKTKNAEFLLGTLDKIKEREKFDIFLVNMLSREFKTFLPDLRRHSKENSLCFVSGILLSEEKEIERYFRSIQMKISKKKVLREWLGYSLLF
ncbi:MAG: 50S ribosomal protein L11 methyltransferase [bacterium]|nr:50S ribosomal protein L11 methyltransferase [bacterium]